MIRVNTLKRTIIAILLSLALLICILISRVQAQEVESKTVQPVIDSPALDPKPKFDVLGFAIVGVSLGSIMAGSGVIWFHGRRRQMEKEIISLAGFISQNNCWDFHFSSDINDREPRLKLLEEVQKEKEGSLKKLGQEKIAIVQKLSKIEEKIIAINL